MAFTLWVSLPSGCCYSSTLGLRNLILPAPWDSAINLALRVLSPVYDLSNFRKHSNYQEIKIPGLAEDVWICMNFRKHSNYQEIKIPGLAEDWWARAANIRSDLIQEMYHSWNRLRYTVMLPEIQNCSVQSEFLFLYVSSSGILSPAPLMWLINFYSCGFLSNLSLIYLIRILLTIKCQFCLLETVLSPWLAF